MSTRKRRPREKVIEARKVPIRAAPVVAPRAVKPSLEAKTVPVAVEKAAPAPKAKAPVVEVKAVPAVEAKAPVVETKPAPADEAKAVPTPELKASVVEAKSVPYAELGVPDAEEKAPRVDEKFGLDYLKTQIADIDSRLRILDAKVKPVDLKAVEDKMMFTIGAVGVTNKSLASIEEEIRVFTTVAKVVFGIGVLGLLGVLWGILRLTGRI